jgi:hypothetical protein
MPMLPFVLATGDPPAGGAALDQVVIASVFAGVGLLALGLIVYRQRTGRRTVVQTLAERLAAADGAPAWAGLPSYLLIGSLLTAVFGMYWDISLHIDNGRDPGPLANPAHWFILIGLFGILVAAVFSAACAEEPLPRHVLRLPGGWTIPYGAALVGAAGTFALLGFPLDDVWHRLFGQDVTLYGPTHLMLIGGASLSTAGGWLLLTEGRQLASRVGFSQKFLEVQLAGAFLIAMSTFQAEFDFSVPQFRMVLDPVLIMVAASVALVTARVRLGRGGALGAVAIFVLVRGVLTLIIGPGLDRTMPHFPLYLAEAVLVELVALRVRPASWVRFGLVSGALIGTVGLAAEWGWSHVWGYLPWPGELWPEAFVIGLLGALAGGVVGSWIGSRLNHTASAEPPAEVARPSRGAVLAPAAGLLVALGAVGFCIPITAGSHVTVQAQLHDVTGGDARSVQGTFTLTPRDAADHAEWFTVTSWQGGGSVVQDLDEVRPGVYRTTEPIPVHGEWKTTLRLQTGTDVLGLPIYMPADEAIPAKEIPATAQFTRDFVRDKKLLQREQKEGVAPWLWTVAYVLVAGIAVVTIAGIARGLSVAARPATGRTPAPYGRDGGEVSSDGTTPAEASRPIGRGSGGSRFLA